MKSGGGLGRKGGSRKGGKREHSGEKGERIKPLEDSIGQEQETGQEGRERLRQHGRWADPFPPAPLKARGVLAAPDSPCVQDLDLSWLPI